MQSRQFTLLLWSVGFFAACSAWPAPGHAQSNSAGAIARHTPLQVSVEDIRFQSDAPDSEYFEATPKPQFFFPAPIHLWIKRDGKKQTLTPRQTGIVKILKGLPPAFLNTEVEPHLRQIALKYQEKIGGKDYSKSENIFKYVSFKNIRIDDKPQGNHWYVHMTAKWDYEHGFDMHFDGNKFLRWESWNVDMESDEE